MFRVLRILTYSLLLHCPACAHGRMFRGLFKMNVRCPACAVIFERDSGEITGGMAINTLLTSTIACLFAGIAFFAKITALAFALGLCFTILFPIIFYRHARGLWTGILYLTGSMFED
jgi:uncharacterized protein (DUF983 family)